MNERSNLEVDVLASCSQCSCRSSGVMWPERRLQ